MPVQKIKITEELAKDLQDFRKSHPLNGKTLSAQDLSYAIGKSRVWISQLESPNRKGKQYVKTSELYLIFEKLLGKEAYKSEEYRNFMARHAENISTDHIVWQNHRSFSRIAPSIYAAIDYNRAVKQSLNQFSEIFKQRIKEADNDEKRFIILRALNMLNRNLQHVPDLAVVLNTTPLHRCEDNAAFSHEVTKDLLSIMDKCIEHVQSFPDSYDVHEIPWAEETLVTALAETKEALNILKDMLDNDKNIDGLKCAYNQRVDKIKSMFEMIYLPHTLISPIEDDKQIDVSVICDHLRIMDDTKKRLAVLLDRIKEFEEWQVSQMIWQSSPEYADLQSLNRENLEDEYNELLKLEEQQ